MSSSHVHATDSGPSSWVSRFIGHTPAGGRVLDLACGSGRHTRLLRRHGYPVTAVDVDTSRLGDLADDPNVEVIAADLEIGGNWPLVGRTFAGIVVTNYLHRPILGDIVGAVAPGGLLIYETFAIGNERFGKPSNPDFLLRPNELLEAVLPALTVIAYQHGEEQAPKPAVCQKICAMRPAD
jgi:SAM-dependent methyltransferase